MAVEMENSQSAASVKVEFDGDFHEDDSVAAMNETPEKDTASASQQPEEDKATEDSPADEPIDPQCGNSRETEANTEERTPSGLHSSLAASLSFNLLSESSKMALTDIAIREKRCRIFEREANEVKDVICSLNHIVHILENIKRVSRDYIHNLYELIGSTLRADNDQVEQLQQEILELEAELKQWEHKYHVMSSFGVSNGSMSLLAGSTAAFLAANSAVANAAALANGLKNASNHHNSSVSSSELHAEDDQNDTADQNDNSTDVELMEAANRKAIAGAQNGNAMMLMPQELCEMSMETTDNETTGREEDDNHVGHRRRAAAAAAAAAAALIMNPSGNSAASSPLIAAAVAAATAATASENAQKQKLNLNHRNQFKAPTTGHLTPTSISLQSNSSSGNSATVTSGANSATAINTGNPSKPLFLCDHPGCNYQTNMRQRLAMHKRAHAGEMLFSCDIPGCGYQSNYKGNIKIHKKHRHRIETSGEQSSYLAPESNGQNQKFRTRGRKRKAQNSPPNQQQSMPVMVPVNPRAPVEMKQFVQSARPSVIVSEDGVEAFIDGVEQNGSSCDMYSGNDSAAKDSDLPLFECTVEGCNYRSKWKQCLTAHQFLHAGVKPFKCDHPGCNYRTNFKGNVNVHKRVHRASEFKCKFPLCNFSTPWKNSFLIHQRNHMPAAIVPTSQQGSTPVAPRPVNPSHQPETPESQMMIEPELPISLSVTTTRRRGPQVTDANHSAPLPPPLNIEVPNGSTSSAGRMNQPFERTPPMEATLMNDNMAEHFLNGISVMQPHNTRSNMEPLTSVQQQTVSLSGLPVGSNGGHFNGHIKEEDEEEMDEEEDDIDEEEDLLAFGQGMESNGMQAFLMNEAANAVSQANAVHLAALRHAQNSQDLRSSVMFDLTRYQEMI